MDMLGDNEILHVTLRCRILSGLITQTSHHAHTTRYYLPFFIHWPDLPCKHNRTNTVNATTATAGSETTGLAQTQQETAKNTASNATLLDELKQRTRQLEAQIEAQLTEKNHQAATTVNNEQSAEGMRYREFRDQQHAPTQQNATSALANEQATTPTTQVQPSQGDYSSVETNTLPEQNQGTIKNDAVQPNPAAPAGTAYLNNTGSPHATMPASSQNTASESTAVAANAKPVKTSPLQAPVMSVINNWLQPLPGTVLGEHNWHGPQLTN